jgi:anti-sigma factor RsiW
MAHPDRQLLERYLDGELRGGRARRVKDHLGACAECSLEAGRSRALGKLLRTAAEQEGRLASLDGIADVVLRHVREDRRLPWVARARVWLGEFIRHQKRVWVPPLTAGGAVAVGVVLFVGLRATTPPGAELPPGSSVLSVSFGRSVEGSLFQLEEKDGTTTAVIWVDEGEPRSEGKRT